MAADARVKITLRCDECKQRNYNTVKNKKNTSDRLERSKYCGAQQVLPLLQKAYQARGDQVTSERTRRNG